ncbi:MAG TPA: hypothetical protein VNW94_08645 [Streptosporangiaceae bacterium]|jgi:hypothetical protein|nr:hypothetical protein [Streptosporangiaceae bacterium]
MPSADLQPRNGHTGRGSLEIYSQIALGPAQASCDGVIEQFPRVKRQHE